ncbi:hypothetical protein EDB92DRAFT_319657 [Lactarius akahatsu]|uniref:Uncharacterized protein n=1 Tax=Lactarius akahatsu TaxID=416441 RepID=A0AAD4LKH7_9AGAM|nr:hypothetical protein EDB92DRAFT_319657 [Lactarius akahatsu]
MMLRLKRAVNILCTLSTRAVLVEGTANPARKSDFRRNRDPPSDVSASYDVPVELFKSIGDFLKRLNIYIKAQSTTVMTETVQGRLRGSTHRRRVASLRDSVKLGKKAKGIGASADRLAREESQTTAALTLDVVYGLAQNLRDVMDR